MRTQQPLSDSARSFTRAAWTIAGSVAALAVVAAIATGNPWLLVAGAGLAVPMFPLSSPSSRRTRSSAR